MWKISQTYNWENLLNQFSWLREMKGVPQDAVYHAEGDVWTHTKMVVEALIDLEGFNELDESGQHQLIAAALMHDIEKRSTTIIENGRISSPNHARKGEKTVRTILYQMNTPFEIRENIAKLVRLHGLPIWAIDKPDFERRLLEASLVVNTLHLYLLAKADVLGRVCEDQQDLLDRLEYFKGLCVELDCWGVPYRFKSNESRFNYFQNHDVSRFYDPFKGNDFEVVLMSALPGSGKDTYINSNYKDLPVVSLDEIRRTHQIAPTDKSGNGRVIQMAKEAAKTYLRKKTSFVWNATNITHQLRTQLISLFDDYGARVRIVYIEVPYTELLLRNQKRVHQLPVNVLEKMVSKFEPPTLSECTILEIHSEK